LPDGAPDRPSLWKWPGGCRTCWRKIELLVIFDAELKNKDTPSAARFLANYWVWIKKFAGSRAICRILKDAGWRAANNEVAPCRNCARAASRLIDFIPYDTILDRTDWPDEQRKLVRALYEAFEAVPAETLYRRCSAYVGNATAAAPGAGRSSWVRICEIEGAPLR
jgi:hypothetical protein